MVARERDAERSPLDGAEDLAAYQEGLEHQERHPEWQRRGAVVSSRPTVCSTMPPDGVWRGRWLQFEQMLIELIALG